MSKGSVQRPDDGAYARNWEKIFGKKPIRDAVAPEAREAWDERMKQLEEYQQDKDPNLGS